MTISPWIFYLLLEFLLVFFLGLAVSLYILSRSRKKWASKLTEAKVKIKLLKQAELKLQESRKKIRQYETEIARLQQQTDTQENPFLQDKVDMLMAEMEELRETADQVPDLKLEIEKLQKELGQSKSNN